MSMNVNTNLGALRYNQLQNSTQGKGIEKLSSGKNVNNNQTDLVQNTSNGKTRFTIEATRIDTNANNIKETNKNNSVQNTSNGKTTFTIEATRTADTNANDINETKQNNSAQKIGDGQTSSATKINNTVKSTTNTSNISSISSARSQLYHANMNLHFTNSYVDVLTSLAKDSASDNVSAEGREMLNSFFNDFKGMIDDRSNRYGTVDSEDKNNIKLSYVSKAEDGSDKESSINISYIDTLKGLGLDKIDISSKEGAMKAVESLTKASSSIKSSIEEIGKSIDQVNKDFNTEFESMFKGRFTRIEADSIKNDNVLQQASVSALSQANQAPAEILKLLS